MVDIRGQWRLLGRKWIRWCCWVEKMWTPFLPQGDSTPIPLASLPIWVLASQAAGNVTVWPLGVSAPP